MAKERLKISQQITVVFDKLLDEYLNEENNNENNVQAEPKPPTRQLNSAEESELIKKFLQKSCLCGKPCKDSLNFDEIKKSRREFSTLSWVEKMHLCCLNSIY